MLYLSWCLWWWSSWSVELPLAYLTLYVTSKFSGFQSSLSETNKISTQSALLTLTLKRLSNSQIQISRLVSPAHVIWPATPRWAAQPTILSSPAFINLLTTPTQLATLLKNLQPTKNSRHNLLYGIQRHQNNRTTEDCNQTKTSTSTCPVIRMPSPCVEILF